jgi:hypothetical protein
MQVFCRSLVTLSVVALLGSFPGVASGQDNNSSKLTFVTFSRTVELPGITLPAGKYRMKLNDNTSNRHIIEVYSEDGQKLHGIVMALAATRRQPSSDTVIAFAETPAGSPAAIRYWFYPGDITGHEFVYPKDQAERIARATGQEVLSTSSTTTDAMRTGPVASTSGSGDPRVLSDEDMKGRRVGESRASEQTAARADQPAERPAPPSTSAPARQAQQPDRANRDAARMERPDELPRTASYLPVLPLVAFMGLAGAAVLRSLRPRS